ncbi:MAG: ATP-binding cassette domain-containing protein [Acidobacteriota bacterium]|nr:ATP-binding cassette domain-containing protein [Acidobacteriota bacterium]
MLDVAVRNLTFRYDGGFALRDVTLAFAQSTHTAVIGPPACGASTLLRLIAGLLRPQSGDIVLGQRRINDVKAARRPLLLVTSSLEVPGRWSVQHALVAAVRTRTLDRQDRHREYALAAEKWELATLLERRVDTLSSTEAARVQLARIELLRPAVLLADRLFDAVSAAARISLADAFFRTMRVFGTTVISVPSSQDELAFTDDVVVLENGQVIQRGRVAEVFAEPVNDAAALATGDIDVVPVTIRGNEVESAIGSWNIDPAPFQGQGVALVRPSDFIVAQAGEESDFIFGVEEAGFADGRWIAHGVLTGGVTLRVELPRDAAIHKGRLIALRYDPTRFRLLPRASQEAVMDDGVPSMAETR